MLNVSAPAVWRKPEEGDCGAPTEVFYGLRRGKSGNL